MRIACSACSAGNTSMTSPRTRKLPRRKSSSLRSYCIATRRASTSRCGIFSPWRRCRIMPWYSEGSPMPKIADTVATITTSRRSISDFVADRRICSMCSLIEESFSINEHIEQMRLSATKSLMERRDVVIVATVSAIFGIGDPSEYHGMILHLRQGEKMPQRDVLARLVAMQYERSELDFRRGSFRVRGDG